MLKGIDDGDDMDLTTAIADHRMRVPVSSLIQLSVPLVGQTVHAGFPSPADDFIEDMIDLNQVLVQNPTATFLWRVVGDCMIDVKIFPGDVVIVDRSLAPKHRSIVLAIIDGEPPLTHILKQTGSFEQASYAIQDTPDMVAKH